jgi:hypothetical protein
VELATLTARSKASQVLQDFRPRAEELLAEGVVVRPEHHPADPRQENAARRHHDPKVKTLQDEPAVSPHDPYGSRERQALDADDQGQDRSKRRHELLPIDDRRGDGAGVPASDPFPANLRWPKERVISGAAGQGVPLCARGGHGLIRYPRRSPRPPTLRRSARLLRSCLVASLTGRRLRPANTSF